jgi:hypothetical protein
VKHVLVYHKLLVKAQPEFAGLQPAWDSIQEKINLEFTSQEEIDEMIQLASTISEDRRQFASSNPDVPFVNSTEIETAFKKLDSAISTLKGE